MRQRLKNKRRSCALCQPRKRGRANRWTARDADGLRRFARERRACEGRGPQRDEQVRGAA